MWGELTRPFILAHRGDRVSAPENTLAAFRQAAQKGADGIEFDVKLTSDGEIIVIHDATVDRTTNGRGRVSHLTLKALRELDAGVQFPGLFPDEKIPTLAEVFETVGNQLYLNIELTNYSTPFDDLVPKAAELVRRHGMEKRVLFSSFLARNLRKAKELQPDVPRGLLTLAGIKGYWGRTFGWRGNYSALHPYQTDVDSGLVDRIHAAGKQVIVWTVNQEDELKKMTGWGVDGIITDDPGHAVRILKKSA